MSKKPLEVSSKRPVAPIKAKKYLSARSRPLDPRFSDLCGRLNMDMVQKNYEFVDALRQEEMRELCESKPEDYKRMESQEVGRLRLGATLLAKRTLRKREQEQVEKTGKMPYFHKHSVIKKEARSLQMDMVPGQLKEKVAERRLKHEVQREKRKALVPSTRRAGTVQ